MKVLALTYYYPPNAGSGTHRSLHFLNRLAAAGDEVTVVTPEERCYAPGTPVDAELSSQVDARIRILRGRVLRPVWALLRLRERLGGRPARQLSSGDAAGGSAQATAQRSRRGVIARSSAAVKDAITDALTFPDEHVGWLPAVLRSGSAAIRAGTVECLYSSGGPWSSHVAAALLKRRHSLPLVLDFRDPWTSNPDRHRRGRALRVLECRLEAFCVRCADQVVVNTEPLRLDFIRRYPREHSSKFTTITNGFEAPLPPELQIGGRPFTLVHAGEIYAPRDPAPFLRALLELLRAGQVARGELRVQFVGGCSARAEALALLATPELSESVEVIARVPHGRALRYQLEADVLLLFQSGFPLQVPRKLFEYMAMSKPVLAIAEAGGATAAIVQDAGVGVTTEPEVGAIKRALLELNREWREGRRLRLDPERFAKYRNDNLALRLRAVLAAACDRRAARVLGMSDV